MYPVESKARYLRLLRIAVWSMFGSLIFGLMAWIGHSSGIPWLNKAGSALFIASFALAFLVSAFASAVAIHELVRRRGKNYQA